ncbi:hypothetical protein HO675_02430 [Streptococcus suis]|nr:hypothetical protein [Streptococcus suis]
MNEETVTKMIMAELDKAGFTILSFDYPQSGTGILLIPDKKELPRLNIDIIAVRNNELYVFENKDRYYPKDFEKLASFKENMKHYTKSFEVKFGLKLLDFTITTFIGLPEEYEKRIKPEKRELIDKIWSVKK